MQHTPHVYLLLWGPNWTADPNQEASATYLENFFSGLGNDQAQDNWSTITSPVRGQHRRARRSLGWSIAGAIHRPQHAAAPTPATPRSAAEADTFATNLGITDLADAQIVVATQSGTCPQGFVGTGCRLAAPSRDRLRLSQFLQRAVHQPAVPARRRGAPAARTPSTPLRAGSTTGSASSAATEYAGTITRPRSRRPAGSITADSASGGEIGDKCARDSCGRRRRPAST